VIKKNAAELSLELKYKLQAKASLLCD